MTEMQKRYCEYYVQTQNKREAYKRAGYKTKNDKVADVEAHRLHKKPQIISYIKELMSSMPRDRVADAEEVCAFLTSVMRGEAKDAFGLDVSMQDRLKAADGLAKRLQLYTQKAQVETTATVTIINDLTDDGGDADGK